MDAELYLTAHRYEQEQVDRLLELRRVAEERAGTGARRSPAVRGAVVRRRVPVARRRALVARPAVARLTGRVAGRHTVQATRDAGDCCDCCPAA